MGQRIRKKVVDSGGQAQRTYTRARAPGVDLKVSRAAEKLAHLISNGSFNNIPLPPLPTIYSVSLCLCLSLSFLPSTLSLSLSFYLPFSLRISPFLVFYFSLSLAHSYALGRARRRLCARINRALFPRRPLPIPPWPERSGDKNVSRLFPPASPGRAPAGSMIRRICL